ncbi:MAG TPA: FAD-dependent monooxygenase [Caulobacteraceae bacterium]
MAPVLIAGGGPTGLALALFLVRQGVPVRIFDKSAAPGETSRAMAVHARTLEFYRMCGFGDEAVRRGLVTSDLVFRIGAREVARARLDDIGPPPSLYPFVLSLPQDEHERLLIEQLTALGVAVERRTELLGFQDLGHAVRAVLSRDGEAETVEAAYLCGCDGAHSTVRHGAGIGFPGDAYEQVFFVADAKVRGEAAAGGLNACLDANGFLLVFPIRSTGYCRLIGIVPREHEQDEVIDYADVSDSVERMSGLKVETVNWFSHYRVHHRVAERFRSGRAFLLGDAAHIHSPAGGQGLNTGVGDAMNLAWKLAQVIRGEAGEALLDSYEPERRGFAQTLVKTTDAAFELIANRSALGNLWRLRVMPTLAALATRFRAIRRRAYLTVSQTAIAYPDSPISEGRAGRIRAGERLPFVRAQGNDNFQGFDGLGWQVHVYGAATPTLSEACEARDLPLRVFAWSSDAAKAGLAENAAYLLRPDGHIGLALGAQDVGAMTGYLKDMCR